MELLASDAGAVRARLLSDGLAFITTNGRHRERLNEYLQTASVDRTLLCVERVGWHGQTYVLPDKIIAPAGTEETVYQRSHDSDHHWNVRGTVDEWRQTLGRKCRGNSRLVFAACCGFAGPLLKLVGSESGGFHLYGPTSTGKTTALIVGGSVCGGGGQAGFVQTWRTTVNGLEAVAATHNDASLFLDELSQVDAHSAGETAYLLGNGMGKTRMNRNIGMRKKLTWKLFFMSAGEMTLTEHAASVGRHTRGGADVRLLNIYADASRGWGLFEDLHGAAGPDAFCRDLKDAALSHYGAPFRAFVTQVTKHPHRIKDFVQKFRSDFTKCMVPKDSTGEVLRAAERFALLGAAGELATKWGLTGWKKGEAKHAARRLFRQWLENRGTKGSSDMHKAIEQVRGFLQTQISRLKRLGLR